MTGINVKGLAMESVVKPENEGREVNTEFRIVKDFKGGGWVNMIGGIVVLERERNFNAGVGNDQQFLISRQLACPVAGESKVNSRL